MSEALLAVIELVASRPWIVLAVPAAFVVFQLAVVRPRNARKRRQYADQATRRAARDMHDEIQRRVMDSDRHE